jgi:hypothetical protein
MRKTFESLKIRINNSGLCRIRTRNFVCPRQNLELSCVRKRLYGLDISFALIVAVHIVGGIIICNTQ